VQHEREGGSPQEVEDEQCGGYRVIIERVFITKE
jgi:hypothetical protein